MPQAGLCGEGKKRAAEPHPHNSESRHLQTRASQRAFSSPGLCTENQYWVLLFGSVHWRALVASRSQEAAPSLSLPNSLHWWQEAPGPLWQALGSAHDVASPCCQVPATRSAWKRQIRAGRARKPLPAGRQDWQPEAGLNKLQPLWPELPWNKSVKGMVRFWQRGKGAQMEKKA